MKRIVFRCFNCSENPSGCDYCELTVPATDCEGEEVNPDEITPEGCPFKIREPDWEYFETRENFQ